MYYSSRIEKESINLHVFELITHNKLKKKKKKKKKKKTFTTFSHKTYPKFFVHEFESSTLNLFQNFQLFLIKFFQDRRN